MRPEKRVRQDFIIKTLMSPFLQILVVQEPGLFFHPMMLKLEFGEKDTGAKSPN
ncbi:MAG: hypothetical protein H0X47_04705 [Nitrospirales bacterium]|nr:hypothetical protein [Nitrospirales bacterium]